MEYVGIKLVYSKGKEVSEQEKTGFLPVYTDGFKGHTVIYDIIYLKGEVYV